MKQCAEKFAHIIALSPQTAIRDECCYNYFTDKAPKMRTWFWLFSQENRRAGTSSQSFPNHTQNYIFIPSKSQKLALDRILTRLAQKKLFLYNRKLVEVNTCFVLKIIVPMCYKLNVALLGTWVHFFFPNKACCHYYK